MLNRVVLVGRLTKNVELKYTTTNVAVVSFTLAVNRAFANKEGEREADFIQCVVWRKQAENMSKYTQKGSLVGIDGRLQVRSYEDNNGNKRYVTEVVCDSVQYLSTKSKTTDNPQNTNKADPYQFQNNNTNQPQKTEENPFFKSDSIDVSDDDLPF